MFNHVLLAYGVLLCITGAIVAIVVHFTENDSLGSYCLLLNNLQPFFVWIITGCPLLLFLQSSLSENSLIRAVNLIFGTCMIYILLPVISMVVFRKSELREYSVSFTLHCISVGFCLLCYVGSKSSCLPKQANVRAILVRFKLRDSAVEFVKAALIFYCLLFSTFWLVQLTLHVILGVIYTLIAPVQTIFLYRALINETLYWRGLWISALNGDENISLLHTHPIGKFTGLRDPLMDTPQNSLHAMLDAENIRLIDIWDLQFKEVIGSGSTSLVYEGKWREEPVAIKRFLLPPVDLTEKDVRAYRKQVEILCYVTHPNIVSFRGLCISPPHIFMVTELCSRGSLDSHLTEIARWNWARRIRLMMNLVRPVAHMHQLDPPIVHRDIKPANFLMRDDWTPGLNDFGNAKSLSKERPSEAYSTIVSSITAKSRSVTTSYSEWGSPLWKAPEALPMGEGEDSADEREDFERGDFEREDLVILPSPRVYDSSVDVFSLGVLMWQVSTGEVPFSSVDTVDEVFAMVKNGVRPKLERAPFINSAEGMLIKELISSCWHEDQGMRPSAHSLLISLEVLCKERPPNEHYAPGHL